MGISTLGQTARSRHAGKSADRPRRRSQDARYGDDLAPNGGIWPTRNLPIQAVSCIGSRGNRTPTFADLEPPGGIVPRTAGQRVRPRSHPVYQKAWLSPKDFPKPPRSCDRCADPRCGGRLDSQSDCFDPIVAFGPEPEWLGEERTIRTIRPRIDPIPRK